MTWKIRGSVAGVQGTIDSLYWLNLLMRRRVIKSAMQRGGKIVRMAAQRNLVANDSVITGQLKRSMGVKTKVYGDGARVVVIIGPRTGFKIMVRRGKKMIPVDPIRYAHLVEGGTRPHALGAGSKLPRFKNGKLIRPGTYQIGPQHPGSRPKPFLRPAFDNNKSAIEASIVNDIQLGITRALAGKQTARPSKRNP